MDSWHLIAAGLGVTLGFCTALFLHREESSAVWDLYERTLMQLHLTLELLDDDQQRDADLTALADIVGPTWQDQTKLRTGEDR